MTPGAAKRCGHGGCILLVVQQDHDGAGAAGRVGDGLRLGQRHKDGAFVVGDGAAAKRPRTVKICSCGWPSASMTVRLTLLPGWQAQAVGQALAEQDAAAVVGGQELARHQAIAHGRIEVRGDVDAVDLQAGRVVRRVEDAAGPQHRRGAGYLRQGARLRRQFLAVVEQVLPLQAQLFFLIRRGAQLDMAGLRRILFSTASCHDAGNQAVHHDQQRQPQRHRHSVKNERRRLRPRSR